MREFTKEMMDLLYYANKEVAGTPKYTEYLMEAEYKSQNRWKFIGHSIPYKPGEIKWVKDRIYIITDSFDGKVRFHVTEKVRKLLGI